MLKRINYKLYVQKLLCLLQNMVDRAGMCYQVRLATTGTHGFLDGTNEYNNWLKLVRATSVPGAHNLRTVLLVGQVGTFDPIIPMS